MRLIDADAFKQEVAALTVKFNLDPGRCNAICKMIDTRPTVLDFPNRIMTIKEYNKEFLPTIDRAIVLLHGIKHALQKSNDYEGAIKQLECIGWNAECQNTILTALEVYKKSVLNQLN